MVTEFEVSKSYKHKNSERVVKILAITTTGDYLGEVLDGGLLNGKKGGTVIQEDTIHYNNWEECVEKKKYYARAYRDPKAHDGMGYSWIGELYETYEGAELGSRTMDFISIVTLEF